MFKIASGRHSDLFFQGNISKQKNTAISEGPWFCFASQKSGCKPPDSPIHRCPPFFRLGIHLVTHHRQSGKGCLQGSDAPCSLGDIPKSTRSASPENERMEPLKRDHFLIGNFFHLPTINLQGFFIFFGGGRGNS